MSIKSVFDRHCRDLKIDTRLANAIAKFATNFVTKNEDHINFFGSGLLGVYPVKWADSQERQIWIDDILQADEIALESDLHALDSINEEFNVQSDVVNNSIIYLIHRFERSNLPPRQIEETQKHLLKILLYKFISSIMSHYFKYPADESIARMTYNQLSNRYDIKRLGTWGALINERAEDFVSAKSIHRPTIEKMQDDDAVGYALSDTQTRIREVIKAYSTVFYQVRDTDSRSFTTSSMIQLEDGLVVKDVKREMSTYSRYIHTVCRSREDFVRTDALNIIQNIVTAANPEVVKATLEYISENYDDQRKKHLVKFVDDAILYSLNFIHDKKIKASDLATVLSRLRAMYTGSRINDKAVLELRNLGDKIVVEARPTSKYPPAAERTSVLLYITLRALAMNHYKSATAVGFNKAFK